MAFKLRSQNPIGTPLSWQEMDDNLSYLLTTMSGSFLTLIGNTSLRNNLSISGSLIISQSLTANNTSSLNDIIPNSNNTYNIGKPTSYWKKAYINNIEGTASYANNSTTSSYTVSSSYANNSTTSSYTVSSSYANNSTSASYALSSSYANNSTSSSYANNSTSASYALTASYYAGGTVNENPIVSILMSNGVVSAADLQAATIQAFNILDAAGTPKLFNNNSRVKISSSIINPNVDPSGNVIPIFKAKLIGEFSATDPAAFVDPDLLSGGASNNFQLKGLKFTNGLGNNLSGLTYLYFNFNFYNSSSPGDLSLNYGWQIETEWLEIDQFNIDSLTDGFLRLMYINDLGCDVYIDRLVLLLQEV